MTTRTLLIYAKPPLMGLAKTRLAAGLGRSEAQRIARFAMARTLRAALGGAWIPRLYTTPSRALSWSLGGLWPTSLARFDQGDGDLTDRLNKGLEAAPPGQVIFIGADAPDITTGLIHQAFRALDQYDGVFGPAKDGGFWLFGLHKRIGTRSPFGNVEWSSPRAMQDVAHHFPSTARIAHLPVLIDLDTAEDWRLWKASQRVK